MGNLPHRNNAKSNWMMSGIHLQKFAKSHKTTKQCYISKSTYFLHSIPLIKQSQKQPFTPQKQKKAELDNVWNSPPKIAKSYKITKCAISPKKKTYFCTAYPLIKQSQNGPFTPWKQWKVELEDVWNSPTKFGKVLQNNKKVLYLWKYTFLHSTPVIKIVLEWAIYPIETMKSRSV